MTSFGHVSHITILGYTMIELHEGRHTKIHAQTIKGYLLDIFKHYFFCKNLLYGVSQTQVWVPCMMWQKFL